MSDTDTVTRDRLVADLRTVVADAEELLKLTAGEVTESSRGLRERLQGRLTQSKDTLLSLQATAAEKAKAAGHAADDYVHEKPWQAIGAGACVGLVVGLLIGRR